VVGDEATLLYGVPGVSSVPSVAEVTRVAAVDIDELVSFRTGGEAPSGCRTWSSEMAFKARWWVSGLAGKRDTGRKSSVLLGEASVKLETGCILRLPVVQNLKRMQNPIIDG
jgi:hypothetical protein